MLNSLLNENILRNQQLLNIGTFYKTRQILPLKKIRYMLDQLIQVVREQAQDAIVNNRDIDDQHNEDAIQEAAKTISGSLQEQLAAGNFKEVMNIFNSKTSNEGNPIIGQITQVFTEQLGSKFHVDKNKAGGIAGSMIPVIIDQLVRKTNDDKDPSIDLNNIFGSLVGKGVEGVNFNDIMGKINGGGKSDGFGLDDVADLVKKGAGSNGAGGLLGSLLGK